MDNSKKFWKAKRIVEWCASGRETELDRTEEGSDEYGRAAGDDSNTTQLAASSESSALTSVKAMDPSYFTAQPGKGFGIRRKSGASYRTVLRLPSSELRGKERASFHVIRRGV
ncbi:hypothetical protein HPB50_001069 [Hyalomma asiaticum]|uniref:Uncharacterized protein n=1 Tax=Hyalomma asiaticum TaxID=266040 RepID=A0ACB7RLZ4_HYAAI|nr:hypothetical protein HPB50_001069 [Hyalomma asiaticum]